MSLDFVGSGISIVGRSAFEDICDIHILALKPDCLQDFCEQFSGATDERLALRVFVGARRLPDDHQIGPGVSHSKNRVYPGFIESDQGCRSHIFLHF